jgi:hypothetical protein
LRRAGPQDIEVCQPSSQGLGTVGRGADSLDDLRCGSAPIVEAGGPRAGDLDPAFADGSVMGKRYVDEAGAELLVTKPGAGSLSVGEIRLAFKEVKPLPASD